MEEIDKQPPTAAAVALMQRLRERAMAKRPNPDRDPEPNWDRENDEWLAESPGDPDWDWKAEYPWDVDPLNLDVCWE